MLLLNYFFSSEVAGFQHVFLPTMSKVLSLIISSLLYVYVYTHTHTHTLLPLIIMKELSTHYPRNKRRKISLHIPTSHSPFRPNDKLQYVFFTMLESRVEKAFNTIHWESKLGFPGRSAGKEYTCNAGDPSSIPGSGRSSGEWIGYPLQYSWAYLVAQLVKDLPATQQAWI